MQIETEGGRKPFHGKMEVFESDETKQFPIECIVGQCVIEPLKQYQLRRGTITITIYI